MIIKPINENKFWVSFNKNYIYKYVRPNSGSRGNIIEFT